MSFSINTNIVAIKALHNVERVSNEIAVSIARLSSGLRINDASDDPAGLIISEGLRAQIDGLNQAIANAQDASNLLKTAEGGMTEISALLRNIRQLVVHAANTGANDQVAIQADQEQIRSAIESIDRITGQTQFGTKKLLDGTAGATASIVDNAHVSAIGLGGAFGGALIQNGDVVITVNNAATRAYYTGGATYASINASISTVNGTSTGAGGTIVLNGQSITVSGSETVQSLINKINNIASTTGVSAAFSSANGSGTVVLTQQNYGGNYNINVSESVGLLISTISAAGTGTQVSGLNATVTVQAQTLINGAIVTTTSTFIGGRASTDSGLRLTDTYGNSILLTEAGNSTGVVNATAATVSTSSLQFQIGGNAGQLSNISLGNLSSLRLGTTALQGKSLASVDVTTQKGAQDALAILDASIRDVTIFRAQVGAYQKYTLESSIRFMQVAVINLSDAESRIRDTDVAAEIVRLTKNQIIQEVGMATLAQANNQPKLLLSLLQQSTESLRLTARQGG